MHRVADNYKWKTLKHWRIAAETGNVQIRVMEEQKVSDSLLENALKLLMNDCFPLTIICCKVKGGKRELWLTALWEGIFDFLDNKRCLKTDGEVISFREMTDDEQKSILNAQVESIWLESD